MTLLTRPGIYQRPVRPSRRIGGLARRDIPVFIGFTQRGPALEPVRVESLRQFEGVFGAPVASSHMTEALRGFFETGGQAAYVLRIVGTAAAPAAVRTDGWVFSARTRTSDLLGREPIEALTQWQDNLRRAYGRSIPDPGGWANGLEIIIKKSKGRSVSATLVEDDSLSLLDLAGLSTGSLINMTGGATTKKDVSIAHLDTLRREAKLASPASLPVGDVRLSETFVDIELRIGSERLEIFEGLSPGPSHPRYVAEVINANSRFLSVNSDQGALKEGTYRLSGGSDGLMGLTVDDWIAALPRQAEVDEIALVAAPDLCRQAGEDEPQQLEAGPVPELCHLPVARPKGNIAGVIVDGETGSPIVEARIEAAGEGQVTYSGANGTFLLEHVTVGLVELRITAEGYLPGNPLIQASVDQTAALLSSPDADLPTIALKARTDIPVLSVDEIKMVQRAMQDTLTVGDFRVAVLDPPGAADTPEALISWAASVGPSQRGFAVAPWIGVGTDTGVALTPPCGHACGAFAVAELGQGVHRAPGNTTLRHAKTVPLDVSDTVAADFITAGINLIEATAGRGIRLMGGRTLSRDPAWVHVSVRRLFDAIERTLLSRLNWAVFEPGNALTRQVLKYSIEQFLEKLRLRGMFAGQSAEEAYTVICDDTVNTQAAQTRGELVVEIGIAPTQPYEFITFSLAAQAEAIDVTEGS